MAIFCGLLLTTTCAIFAQDSGVFRASYDLRPLALGQEKLVVKLPVTNLRDVAVESSYIKTSCSCTSPLKARPVQLGPGESKLVDFQITLPRRRDDVRVSIVVYCWPVGAEIPKQPKLSDMLVVSEFSLNIPIRNEVEFFTQGGYLEVRPNHETKFICTNWTDRSWNSDVQFESSLSGVSIQAGENDAESAEKGESFVCQVLGLESYFSHEDKPESIDIKVFLPLRSNGPGEAAFALIYQETLKLDFYSELELRPTVLRAENPNSYVTINCSNGNANDLLGELAVLDRDGTAISDGWKSDALSAHWIRIQFDLTNPIFDAKETLSVAIPSLYWKKEISIR